MLVSLVMLASFTLALPAGAFYEYYSQNQLENYRFEHYNPDDGWVWLLKVDEETKTKTKYICNDELGEAVLTDICYYCKPDENPKDLVVPETIEGHRVTSIYPIAFKSSSWIETITIPEGVRDLGDWACGWCTALTSVSLPESLEKIGAYAFYRDYALTEIVIPDNVSEIGEGAFWGCIGLTDAKLPANLTEIPNHLFYRSWVEHVNIPDGVRTIGDYAFNGCINLAEINIPDGVEKIGDSAFLFCESVKKVVLPDSVNELGWHAFRDMPALEEVELSSSLETVAPYAFADCPNLEAVVIPEGVKNIGDGAFGVITIDKYHAEEGKLFAVVLPSTIESIGEFAFANNGDLTIYYGGTEEQWANVEIGDDNDEILNANIVFLGDETGDGPAEGDPVEPVEEIIAGDVNGDGIVNSKDLTRFMKYLAGQDVTVVEEALDVTGDGTVNTKDLIRLLKFLSGEIITIG